VTRKITRAVARIRLGLEKTLYLGNLEAKRDWGYAPEYVEAMWRMVQQESPGDYVVGTGESHSVREFCELAFQEGGIELEWRGSGVEEKGVVASASPPAACKPGEAVVAVDPRYFRPTEVAFLLADASKAKRELGWEPRTTIRGLVRIMVQADMVALEEMKHAREVIRKIVEGK
jgi:GDPmannose 4,6-dehydratase